MTREQIVADYQTKFDAMKVTRLAAVESAAKRVLANMDTYKAAEAKTGVPAEFIGALHMRECNNNMRGVLHNGELIVGTGRKTRLVPRGRGPFATWEEAAVDALNIEGFSSVTDWSPAVCCYEGERYNGLGYRHMGKPSPYLWAGSQWYTSGKYVADGVYSSNAVDSQLGIAPVMKRVAELSVPASDPAPPLPTVTPKDLVPVSRKASRTDKFKKAWQGISVAGILSSLGMAKDTALQVQAFVGQHWLAIVITFAVLSILFAKWLESLFAEDVNEGRSVPSGGMPS